MGLGISTQQSRAEPPPSHFSFKQQAQMVLEDENNQAMARPSCRRAACEGEIKKHALDAGAAFTLYISWEDEEKRGQRGAKITEKSPRAARLSS